MYAIIRFRLMLHTTCACDIFDYNEATEDDTPLHTELMEARDSVSELIRELAEKTGKYAYIPGAFTILPEGVPHAGTLIVSEIFRTNNASISSKDLKKLIKAVEEKLEYFNNGYSDGHAMDITGKILRGLYDDNKAIEESCRYAYAIQDELDGAEAMTYYQASAELQPTPEQEKELAEYFESITPHYDKCFIVSSCVRYTADDEAKTESFGAEMHGLEILVLLSEHWKSVLKEEFCDAEDMHYIPAIFSMPVQDGDDEFSYAYTIVDIVMGTDKISPDSMEKSILRMYRTISNRLKDELVFPVQVSLPNITPGNIDSSTVSSLMSGIATLRKEKDGTIEEFNFDS